MKVQGRMNLLISAVLIVHPILRKATHRRRKNRRKSKELTVKFGKPIRANLMLRI